MDIRVVNLEEKARKITELHKYKLVAELNDYQFKMVKAKRDFVWHSHLETDELFFVVDGRMKLALRDAVFPLNKGELIVVPKGVEHKPVCETECTVMLIEPKGTLNTGNAGGSLTDTELEWI
ncbi:MAG TPA: cupin domain-containing protein [Chitinivibrionales bacterium]|nr:cupin domain-containing protein [Chitinivibrionales bacterium]